MPVIPDGYELTKTGRLMPKRSAWAIGAVAMADDRLGTLREACRKKADERLVAQFDVPGKVVGKGRPRFGGGSVYTPAATVAYEKLVATYACDAMGDAEPVDGPVRLYAAVAVGLPKRLSKRDAAAALAEEILPTSKPDADNYLKIICDAINRIVWVDDAQVVDARIVKHYAIEPSLHVRVERLA